VVPGHTNAGPLSRRASAIGCSATISFGQAERSIVLRGRRNVLKPNHLASAPQNDLRYRMLPSVGGTDFVREPLSVLGERFIQDRFERATFDVAGQFERRNGLVVYQGPDLLIG
jgi:hypothetical protein